MSTNSKPRYALACDCGFSKSIIMERYSTYEEAKNDAVKLFYGRKWEILEWDNISQYYDIVETNY